MSMTARMNGRPKQQRPKKTRTQQYRRWRGVNQVDSRSAMEDDELFWLENAITVGNGAIQLVPAAGPTIATITNGVTIWGFTLNGNAVTIVIGSDGAITQVTPGGVTTVVATAGTVTSSARCTIWRATEVLIVDPTMGYSKWDGTTYTTISASKVGTAIAVFQGRVWIANGRTIEYTAPTTNNDFTVGNGAGSTIITDEAFQGNVVNIVSAQEQLWIVGQSAIDAISNVQSSGTAPNVTTTFSLTNIVTSLGTLAPSSVIGYFRALTLLAPYGAYALSGVTPQKLSDKLDGLFPKLTISATSVSAAVAVVQSLPCLIFRVTYNGNEAKAGQGPIALMLCFTQGKWFFAVQRTTCRHITSLTVDGVQCAFGVDTSGNVFKLFGASASSTTAYRVRSKLFDFGAATTEKALLKVGLEIQAESDVSPTMTIDSEFGSQTVNVTTTNELTLVNQVNATLQLQNSLGNPLNLISQGTVLSRQNASLFGRYLGFTVEGEDIPYRIQAAQMEVVPTREWQAT